MKKSKIYLSTSHFSKDGIEATYIKDILAQNKPYLKDENINLFEKKLENYLGENSKVACLSSGTSAIHLALIISSVKTGDEVLCQSFTFSASANPIVYQNATPVFIDSEVDTWNMCPVALEKTIKDKILNGKKPKAIIVVHIYGMPCKIEEIALIAKKYNIKLIEDAAEALGSKYKGKNCGTFGDFGIISFNGNKIITTSGGGALVCKNDIDKNRAIFLATQARDKTPHYQHSKIGYNYRMSNILAGIGRGQIALLEQHVSLRRRNNQYYQNQFNKTDGITVFKEPNSDYFSNHWLSCILIDENITGFNSEKLRLHLLKENIESRPLWKPLHLQPVFKNNEYIEPNISESLFLSGLCLPSGSNLEFGDLERIKITINNLL